MKDIRIANQGDYDDILAINTFFDYGNSPKYIENTILQGNCIVLQIENKIVGYLLVEYIWGNQPFLALVHIVPDFQRKGHIADMLIFLEEILIKKGYTEYISSTISNNLQAIGFHEKYMFEETGTLNMKHGEEIFYSKKIGLPR